MALTDIEPGMNNPAVSKYGKFKRFLPWALLVLTLAVAGGLGTWQYRKYQKLSKELSDIKSDPQKVAADQISQLLNKVGQLIVLPDNEQPTVATVTDLAALKDQPFFEKAEVGDKVLIYTKGKRAILYRERQNKIVEVAPVNIGNTQAAPQGTVAGSSTQSPTQPGIKKNGQ